VHSGAIVGHFYVRTAEKHQKPNANQTNHIATNGHERRSSNVNLKLLHYEPAGHNAHTSARYGHAARVNVRHRVVHRKLMLNVLGQECDEARYDCVFKAKGKCHYHEHFVYEQIFNGEWQSFNGIF